MSFKAKIAAGAATFALVGGGLGMLGTLSASASTPNCGGCSNWYTAKYHQQYVLDILHGQASSGNEVILFQRSDTDPAQDFVTTSLGEVKTFYNHERGLVAPGFDQQYGNDEAIQIQYEPNGVNSNFCVGTWPGEAVQNGFKVRLEPCGYTNTIWAIDETDTNNSNNYTPLIAGTNEAFSNPEVLNYPAGNPTDMPRPWLNVQPLASYSTGTVYDNQLWRNTDGF